MSNEAYFQRKARPKQERVSGVQITIEKKLKSTTQAWFSYSEHGRTQELTQEARVCSLALLITGVCKITKVQVPSAIGN